MLKGEVRKLDRLGTNDIRIGSEGSKDLCSLLCNTNAVKKEVTGTTGGGTKTLGGAEKETLFEAGYVFTAETCVCSFGRFCFLELLVS